MNNILGLIADCEPLLSPKLDNISDKISLEWSSIIDTEINKAFLKRKANRESIPDKAIFVFHAQLMPSETVIRYRDITMSQHRDDYVDLISYHAKQSMKTNPGHLWVLIKNEAFNIDSDEYISSLVKHGRAAIVNLNINTKELMFQRVLAMYAYRRGIGGELDTAFLDGDAFPLCSFEPFWLDLADIFLTIRHILGLMPVNEGVMLAKKGDAGKHLSLLHLGTYLSLLESKIVASYYGSDIKRWRGGQLALNIVAKSLMSNNPLVKHSFKPRFIDCETHNFTPHPSAPLLHDELSFKTVLHLKGAAKDLIGQAESLFSNVS